MEEVGILAWGCATVSNCWDFVRESRTFPGAVEFMRSHGVEVIDLDLPECVKMMEDFIAAKPELWNEDIGE